MSKRHIAEKARANTNGVELDSFAQGQTLFSANLTETPQSQDQVKIPVTMSHKIQGHKLASSEHAKPKLGSFFQIVLYPLKPKQVKSSSLHYFKVTTSCLVASDPGPFHCNPTLMLCRVLSEIRTSSD